MKKLLSLTLALALGLTACGGGGSGGTPPLYSSGDVTKISESGAFDRELYDLEELDADTAFMVYGLEGYGLAREDMKECTVLSSAGATCEEAAVLVLADADKAETAEDALKNYIQSQISANEDYRPDEIPKLKDAYLDRRGESLLLVVASDVEAAKEAVE